jgi:hypothetical protein
LLEEQLVQSRGGKKMGSDRYRGTSPIGRGVHCSSRSMANTSGTSENVLQADVTLNPPLCLVSSVWPGWWASFVPLVESCLGGGHCA